MGYVIYSVQGYCEGRVMGSKYRMRRLLFPSIGTLLWDTFLDFLKSVPQSWPLTPLFLSPWDGWDTWDAFVDIPPLAF